MAENDLSAMLLGDNAGENIDDAEVQQVAQMLSSRSNAARPVPQNYYTPPVNPPQQAPNTVNTGTPVAPGSLRIHPSRIKEIKFARFIEAIKEKLPEKQKQIVTQLNEQFSHNLITFLQYRERLLAGIGKMKYEILAKQFTEVMQNLERQKLARGPAVQQYPPPGYAVRQPIASPITANPATHSGVNVRVISSAKKSAESISKEDIALVNISLLRSRIEAITNRFQFGSVDENLVELLHQALRQRMTQVTEELVSISRKRSEDNVDSCFGIVVTSDTKTALRDIEKRERDIAQRKSAEEKQRLLEAARANKKDKRDNKVLQDKLNKVVQEEEAKRTNDTALIAIGDVRGKKTNRRKISTSARVTAGNKVNPVSSPMPTNFSSGSNTPLGASTTSFNKITYRDALIFAERDVFMKTNHSAVARKCFFGEDALKYAKEA